MEPWNISDLLLYGFLFLGLAFFNYGPLTTIILLAKAIPYLSIQLPLRMFVTFYIQPFERIDTFSRTASTFEFVAVDATKWLLSNFNPETVAKDFFGRTINEIMYKARRLRYGTGEVGDVQYTPIKNQLFKGYKMDTLSRGSEHDIVVYFVPGNVLGVGSAYVYLEFCALFIMSLLEKGFRNPCIIVVDLNYSGSFKQALRETIAGYKYIQTIGNGSHVLMASSVGATVSLSLLLHLASPLSGFEGLGDCAKPDGLVLISPMTKVAKQRIDSPGDYVCNIALAKLTAKLIDPLESTQIYTMPGMLQSREWWRCALPKKGVYIHCGENESLLPEISSLFSTTCECGQVQFEKEVNHVHASCIAECYMGRGSLSRHRGPDKIASQIAQMVLWDLASGVYKA